jgi:hypothetical protein
MSSAPVRCIACNVTFLRAEHYLFPAHGCLVGHKAKPAAKKRVKR